MDRGFGTIQDVLQLDYFEWKKTEEWLVASSLEESEDDSIESPKVEEFDLRSYLLIALVEYACIQVCLRKH